MSTNYLDDVSVVDVTAPGIELLQNPSFESSIVSPTGWVGWCQSSCTGTADEGRVNNTQMM